MKFIRTIIKIIILIIIMLFCFYSGVYYQFANDKIVLDDLFDYSVTETYDVIFENCVDWFCEGKDCLNKTKHLGYKTVCTELITGKKVDLS